ADMVRFVQEMRIVRDERLIEQVPVKAERLASMLRDLERDFPSLVYNVRGFGMYQGFSLRGAHTKSSLLSRALETEDLLLLGAGADTVRLRPHLHVSEGDIDDLGRRLRRLLGHFSD